MEIKNMPTYASNYKYLVVRDVNNELWFWGAYKTITEAEIVASDINGTVLHNIKNNKEV